MDMKRKLEVMKEIEESNRKHYEEWKEAQQLDPLPPSPPIKRRKSIRRLDAVSWALVGVGGVFIFMAVLGYDEVAFVLHGVATTLGGVALQLITDLL